MSLRSYDAGRGLTTMSLPLFSALLATRTAAAAAAPDDIPTWKKWAGGRPSSDAELGAELIDRWGR